MTTGPLAQPAKKVAVVGAGWAGLAAAVRLVQQGHQVTLLEMAAHPGGRARQVQPAQRSQRAECAECAGGQQPDFDNGQHILIGAYHDTLALMRAVGADPQALLLRQPLVLRYPDGAGLALPKGRPMLAFARAVLGASGWTWRARLALLTTAGGWLKTGFQCAPALTVQQLCQGLPLVVQDNLIAPLCVAALNTPAESASAAVFLRVLKDALFAGAGGADLLLPRAPLSALLPHPAWTWLLQAGALCTLGQRVMALAPSDTGWRLLTAKGDAPGAPHEGDTYNAVVLACTATEAARLAAPHQPGWAQRASALRYEPIVTAYLTSKTLRLPHPMLALRATPAEPAQFVFDLQAIGRLPDSFAWVVSGAGAWFGSADEPRGGASGTGANPDTRTGGGGLAACGAAVLRQARSTFPGAFDGPDSAVLQHLSAERRATFACLPSLHRPTTVIAPGLVAAGDYIAGPYPATLEGAVRSGNAAAMALA